MLRTFFRISFQGEQQEESKKEEEGEEEDFSRTVFPRACGFCLLCYVSQAIINIAVPIVLPIVFVLFFLGLGAKKARP